MIAFLRPRIGGNAAATPMSPFFRPRGIGGDTGQPWYSSAITGGTNALRDVLIAREQRRPVGAGADANSLLAMQPGSRGGAVASFGGNNLAGMLPVLLVGGVAVFLLLRR